MEQTAPSPDAAPAPRRWLPIAAIAAPVIMVLGSLAGRVSDSGAGNPWYDALIKPAAQPPGWAFGVAWAILYALMGVAVARILAHPPSLERRTALALFLLQLILNFAWSPLFFGAQQIFMALVLILAIFAAAVATTFAFARVDRIAAWLLVPYLAWLTFATILNFQFLQLNS